MFKDLIKEMKRLEKQQSVSIPINTDNDGYVDKECPAEGCLFKFKVQEDDWGDLFKDEAVFCPLCGHLSTSDSWWTTEQLEEGKRQALEQVKSQIGSALSRGAKKFNRQKQSGFITMKMKVSGSNTRNVIMPISAQEEMEQKIKCEECDARYSVVGVAFFCPCCGHNSVERMFDSSMGKVKCKLDNLDKIQRLLIETGQKDEAIVTRQSLLESSLSDCVTALQSFCEKKYEAQAGAKKVPFNGFQRIDFADTTWRELLGEGYKEWLTCQEFHLLRVLFQRRHLLQHCEGVVDQKYIDKSEDKVYKLGQRIVVKRQDVEALIDIVGKITSQIRLALS